MLCTESGSECNDVSSKDKYLVHYFKNKTLILSFHCIITPCRVKCTGEWFDNYLLCRHIIIGHQYFWSGKYNMIKRVSYSWLCGTGLGLVCIAVVLRTVIDSSCVQSADYVILKPLCLSVSGQAELVLLWIFVSCACIVIYVPSSLWYNAFRLPDPWYSIEVGAISQRIPRDLTGDYQRLSRFYNNWTWPKTTLYTC